MSASLKSACELAPPDFQPLISDAFDGDIAAARELALSLPAKITGDILINMFNAQIPKPAFRAYLQTVWSSQVSRIFVIGAHGSQFPANQVRRNLARLFAYAEFARPEGLPPQMRVYRATHSISAEVAATGLYWSTKLLTAKFAAFHFKETLKKSEIRIVAADVGLHEITYFLPNSEAGEVIIVWPPAHFTEHEVILSEPVFSLMLSNAQEVAA